VLGRAELGRAELGRAEPERGPRGAVLFDCSAWISSICRFGGLTGPRSSSKVGASRRGAAGRLKAGRSVRSAPPDFFQLGLAVKERPAPVLPVPAASCRIEPARERSYAGRSGTGRSEAGVPEAGLPGAVRSGAGRPVPVEPAPNRDGGRVGRSSFFHAGRVPGRAEVGSAGRPAGRAGRNGLSSLRAKEPAPRLGRSAPKDLPGRESPKRAGLVRAGLVREGPERAGPVRVGPAGRICAGPGSGRASIGGTGARRGLALGRSVGNWASRALRRRVSFALGVRSLPSAALRSSSSSSGSSSRRLPGS
jgi:hypothetical protein